MKRSIKQVWHPYWLWEEIKHNMWGSTKEDLLQKAIDFTGDHKLYGSYMLRVTQEWPCSCEHNLTANQNRRAWIGHAAVALAFQCPEDIVRQAWWHLTDEQRELANKEAEKAIAKWETDYVQKKTHTKCITGSARTCRVDV